MNKGLRDGLIGLLLLAITLTSCSKKESEDQRIGESEYSNLLEIASSNLEVKSYLENKIYTTEISKVTTEDKAELPSVHGDLEGELYKIYYKTDNFDILVVMNRNRVLKVVPISSLKI